MASPNAQHVLLLRAPSTNGVTDPYEESFNGEGYRPNSVPVLETTLTNLPELCRIILAGPVVQQIQGIIITSKRAVDAWSDAILNNGVNSHEASEANWTRSTFFAVGESTAKALRELHASLPPKLCPTIIAGAHESGTSERLAEYIVQYYTEKSGIRLLCLTGDKNRDTLPSTLAEAGIDLVMLRVYETRGSSQFAENLREILESSLDSSSWWLVFFAPSTADFTVPILREHFQLSIKDCENLTSKKRAKIAAIGPTTETHLRDKLMLEVHAAASKPKPTELVRAIVEYDQQLS